MEQVASMMKTALTKLIAGAAFAVITTFGAVAAEPEELGQFTDWSAFALSDGGQKVCWMVTLPKNSKPGNVQRGEIHLFVTHRPNHPAGPIKNEVSVVTGYTYNPGSEVAAKIGSKKFAMFTQGDGAWLKTEDDEAKMIAAMKAGRDAVVEGVSSRNTTTIDTYSLSGFTKAHKSISTACGVR